MSELGLALLLATLAGAAIPAGAALAEIERLLPRWTEREVRHFVVAFGGGVLLGAVALVLVPQGMDRLPLWHALAAFGAGGLVFALVDRAVARAGGSLAQLMAMVLDFVPETLAMGAMFAGGETGPAVLLALLIAAQNLPEGFNASRELTEAGFVHGPRSWSVLAALVPLGPLAAWAGYAFLVEAQGALGGIMLFAAGGILYLSFGDIAPAARLRHAWAPPLGAVAGFAVAMWGHAVTA